MSKKYYRTRIRVKLKEDDIKYHLYMYNGNLDILCDIVDFNRVNINTYDYQWIKYYETIEIYTDRGDLDAYLSN